MEFCSKAGPVKSHQHTATRVITVYTHDQTVTPTANYQNIDSNITVDLFIFYLIRFLTPAALITACTEHLLAVINMLQCYRYCYSWQIHNYHVHRRTWHCWLEVKQSIFGQVALHTDILRPPTSTSPFFSLSPSLLIINKTMYLFILMRKSVSLQFCSGLPDSIL